jgi:hypothetical protein
METLVTILATTLLVTGLALWRLPVGDCPQCPHCAALKLATERETEAETGRVYGIPLCPTCGAQHGQGEPHRR